MWSAGVRLDDGEMLPQLGPTREAVLAGHHELRVRSLQGAELGCVIRDRREARMVFPQPCQGGRIAAAHRVLQGLRLVLEVFEVRVVG